MSELWLVGLLLFGNRCERERENDLSGQTYLYRIIYRHSQILANTPNIMGTLRSAECPRNIERITSSKTFLFRVVYFKPLGEKSRIVKLVPGLKKKPFFFCFFLPERNCISVYPSTSYEYFELVYFR